MVHKHPSALQQAKRNIADDLKAKIANGEAIDGEVLPENPVTVRVVGKSMQELRAIAIYREQAPYYFRVNAELPGEE